MAAPNELKDDTKLYLQEAQFRAMVSAYERELPAHIRRFGTFVGHLAVKLDVAKYMSGGLVNTGAWLNNGMEVAQYAGEKTLNWARGKKIYEEEMKVGCRELQTKTFNVLDTALKRAVSDARRGYPRADAYWDLKRIQAGLCNLFGWHHAVRVTSKLSRRRDDLVFDPWYEQAPRIYSYSWWNAKSYSPNTTSE